jgi:DNA-binding transcriptional ArsR family regulator
MSPRARGGAAARAWVADAAPVFAALADETRLGIVAQLCAEGPLSTARLSASAGVSRQAVTKHLTALSDAGLVESSRGRPRLWRLEPARIDDARRSLDRIAQQWDDALGRLKAFVEK